MLSDYINWFNNFRIHGSLDYLSLKEYKLHELKKISNLVLTIQNKVEHFSSLYLHFVFTLLYGFNHQEDIRIMNKNLVIDFFYW